MHPIIAYLLLTCLLFACNDAVTTKKISHTASEVAAKKEVARVQHASLHPDLVDIQQLNSQIQIDL